jgi:hypothetical protein
MPRTVSIDREAVSRPAVRAAQALVEAIDLSGFRLAGGTALAWVLGHRRSDDLDFFTRVPGGLGVDARARLGKALQRIPATAVDVQDEKTVHANVAGCRVSFFEIRGRWVAEPVITREGILLADVDDIVAMKVVSVLTRSARKDFYDIHALRRHGYRTERIWSLAAAAADLDEEIAEQLARALTDFSDAELDPDPITLDGTTWAAAKMTATAISQELATMLHRGLLP